MGSYGTERRNIADPKLTPQKVLDNLDMDLSDFADSRITDIGAGISPLSTYIATQGKALKTTFVDPIYNELTPQELHKKNKKYITRIIQEKMIKAKELSEKQSELITHIDQIALRNSYYAIESDISKINHTQKLIDQWASGVPPQIELNTSSGKNIQGIDSHSQDFVIIQYLLNNIDNDDMFGEVDIIREAQRILAHDGYLLIINPGDMTKRVIPIPGITQVIDGVSYIKSSYKDIDSLNNTSI